MLRAFIVAFFTIASASGSLAQQTPIPLHPYIGYDIYETRKTDSDHREITTEIFLTGDDYVGFRYQEKVLGSVRPSVKAIEFSNEYQRKATQEEQASLTRDLVAAGVFGLTNDAERNDAPYTADLDVRINRREARLSFYTPPSHGKRKVIHDIMLRFAREMKIDQPSNAEVTAITITEGDAKPPQHVGLEMLLATPAKFHGKRVSVIGYSHEEFESHGLYAKEKALRADNKKQRIWRGLPSTFAKEKMIQFSNDAWLRVEGVFLRGPAGHLGAWPGEIVRVTRIEPVVGPSK